MKVATSKAWQLISRREGFTTHGSLTGDWLIPYGAGILPEPYRTAYGALRSAGQLAYVVRSYQTPIGWVDKAGNVTIPAVQYSRTTSTHQGQVRRGLGADYGVEYVPAESALIS